jgi:hypothetical protein
MVAVNRFFSRFSWDVVGFSASAMCAIHCAVIPLILIYSSVAGGDVVHNHIVENVILVFSASVGAISLFPSFRKHHQKRLPIVIFMTGLLLIIGSRLSSTLPVETILTTTGALTIASAHFINWRLCRPYHVRS